jgi:acyl-coenzyme A thioesterase PaaI-like protein
MPPTADPAWTRSPPHRRAPGPGSVQAGPIRSRPVPDLATDYPPPRHVLRDLRLVTEIGRDRTGRASLPIPAELRGPDGCPHAGVVATAVDMLGGGLAAVAARPDWIATADLSLHLLPRPVATLELAAHVARRGRTTAVLEVDLTGDGAPHGLATMTFAVLPRRDTNPVVTMDDDPGPMTLALADSGFATAFEDQAGIRRLGDGRAELPITDYVRNSLGAVQGGLMASTAVAAAAEAGAARLGSSTIVDLQITYLALGRVGPVVATATTDTVDADDLVVVRVELSDAGADDRLTTVVHARAVRA